MTAVVGFRAVEVMAAAPDLTFVYNPDYATTNTSQSLLRALELSPPGRCCGSTVTSSSTRGAGALSPLLGGDESFVCVNTASVGQEEVKYTVDAAASCASCPRRSAAGSGRPSASTTSPSADKALLVDHLRRCEDQDYFERGLETAIAQDGMRVRPVDLGRFAAVEVDVEADLLLANLVDLQRGQVELTAP